MSSGATANKAELLLRAQAIRQHLLELELFERKWKQSEKDGSDKETQTNYWMEVMNRKENFKTMSSLVYETPLDLPTDKKRDFRQFFDALDGYTWANNYAYTGQTANVARPEIVTFEASVSLYDGVTCKLVDDKPVIQQLDLAANGLRGELPPNESFLHMCEILNLSLNRLSGRPPLQGPKHPWAQLKILRLSGNQLTNTTKNAAGVMTTNVHLLSGLQHLTQLEVLDLSFNDFRGAFPDIFGYMKNLEVLNLAGNMFEGNLPPSIGGLANLKELKLFANQFSGNIPESFAQLRYLKAVNLSQNRLTGGLNIFNNIGPLEVLILNHNQLSGCIDDSIGNLRNVYTIHLQNNQITGIIPDTICKLKKLRYLDLSHNQLRGLIPLDIGNLEVIEKLLLMDNNIVGPVPRSIANVFPTLRDFYVFRPFPSQLSKQPRGYNKKYFERVYIFAPNNGIDNVFWSEDLRS